MPNCKHGIDARFCAACLTPLTRRDRYRSTVKNRAQLRAPANDIEREALEAVYAYEEALSAKNGKRTSASRTWRMIAKRGIIGTLEEIVTRRSETAGYRVLVEMGLEDMAFEAVVTRHPEAFSRDAVE